ncbi:MAG: Stp1/IreP family PP2C-type Ser/Thr phosphatase [Ruminococcaceae bacterium]|nr:Stp1/IreP family PP2C-type Ser/Thr phosphatase [Oscillospiraceae bacterium]
MKIFGKTDIGLVRSSNQDAFRIGKFDSGTVWAVLCDGMGGASGGDIASKMAVDLIAERILSNYNDNMKTSSVANLLESAINFASIKIFDIAREDETLSGMGTTVVAAVIRDGEAMISHAGDSRAYIIGEDIRQVTTDHSIVQEMLDRGEITEEEAKHHPIKNYITRALGVKDRISVDFTTEDFGEDDILLMCSDGFSNMIESDSLKELIKCADDDTCKKLVDTANSNGGKDNITVVIASY